MRPLLLALPLLAACSGDAGPPSAADCAEICAKAAPTATSTAAQDPARVLSDFEFEVLQSRLEGVRAGVRPADDQSVGVCVKVDKRDCGEFMGAQAGELPPGEYMLAGAFLVPDAGEEGTWTVDLAMSCETDKEDGSSTRERTKTYTVKYPGKDRTYRLAPLEGITSPGEFAERCTYSFTMKGPAGDSSIEGGWSVPAAGG